MIREVYTEAEPFSRIGFRDENNGTTSYYSSNVTKDDAKFVDEWCQSMKPPVSPLNTRLTKNEDGSFELKVASTLDTKTSGWLEKTTFTKERDGKQVTLTVTLKDFPSFMHQIVEHLKLAMPHTSDENQAKMLENYIEHFESGSIPAHKDSQRNWIKDVGPIVETNIGPIETYLDPLGVRAEFEGFVAIVDKEVSAKFNQLVDEA